MEQDAQEAKQRLSQMKRAWRLLKESQGEDNQRKARKMRKAIKELSEKLGIPT